MLFGATTGSVVGFKLAEAFAGPDIFHENFDLLVPVAIETVINSETVGGIVAPLIVEGAHCIKVVPDVLANARVGMFSWFVWDKARQGLWWTTEEVNQRLINRMTIVWEQVEEFAKESKRILAVLQFHLQ